MTLTITWNETSSESLPNVVFGNPVRQLLGNHRGTFLEIPGKRGSWYYPEVRGRRTITIPGFFLDPAWKEGERRNTFESLANWLDVETEARLTFSDDPEHYYEAVLGDCGDIEEWRELGTFELQWFVRPFAFDLLPSAYVFTLDSNDNVTFEPDVSTPVEMVVTIVPMGGYLEIFDLILNGVGMSWTGMLLAGQTLTINGISATVTRGTMTDAELTGAYDPADLDMVGITGGFSRLRPGTNTLWFIRQLGTATSFEVTIHYRKAYRR